MLLQARFLTLPKGYTILIEPSSYLTCYKMVTNYIHSLNYFYHLPNNYILLIDPKIDLTQKQMVTTIKIINSFLHL